VHGTGREDRAFPGNPARHADAPEAANLPASAGNEPGAGGRGLAPGGQGLAPGGGSLAPGGQGLAPGGQGPAPGGQGLAPGGEGLAAAKAALRGRLLAARRELTSAQRDEAGRRLRDAVLALPEVQMAGAVAAYFSVGTEPDTRGLVYALWKRGTYVLLPVLLPGGDLDWASYEGPDSLAAGPRGLLEPTEPPRGVTAVTSADVIIVPAVAADRAGNRLGRGGGSYDRALARVGPSILTIALLYDGELVERVPAGPRDTRVRAAALPTEGISRLG
jgi:5-formyltetrahydrofolate cyclo-ligase